MQLIHKNNNKKSILVFFTGWATPFNLFNSFFSDDKDLLGVWDYRNTDFEFDFSRYEQIDVASFSYGVFMSQFANIPTVNSNTAICGTLYPRNKQYGINPKMFDFTLKTLTEETLEKFYQNMFSTQNEYEQFKSIQNAFKMDINALKEELENIKQLSEKVPPQSKHFTKALIAQKDRIIPSSAQMVYWQDKTEVVSLNCGHFPFFSYKVQELLN